MDEIKFNFNNIGFSEDFESEAGIIPLMSDDDEQNVSLIEVPDVLPILPLRNTVLYPGVIIPISLGRDKSLRLINDIKKSKGVFGAVAQIDMKVEEPGLADLYPIGTVARIIKVLEMPDNSTSIIIQGKRRIEVESIISTEPYMTAKVRALDEPPVTESQMREFEAIVGSIKDLSIKLIQGSGNIPSEASFAVKNISGGAFLINFIATNTEMPVHNKQEILACEDQYKRGMLLLEYLSREVQLLDLKNDIQTKVKQDIDQQQREYLLQQQIRTIQDELGSNPVEQEVNILREAAKDKKWNESVAQTFEKEIDKLQRLNPNSGEFSVQVNYLQTLLDLPWNEYTKDNFDLKRADKILDRDHFGLDQVKERILEHLAVLKLKGDLKSPIICLYGPPGVGKTSLGKSVAEALGRKYVRMSLGGLHDEAEIRGHRKTYIGAMPGRILQNIKKAGSSNPVFILDELDKISSNFHGDPAAALLEVLDPEQNSTFHDNFLEIDFDLSKVMFMATANNLASIAPPLLDRMELIDVSGYIIEEKTEIAIRHLIPRQMENHGIPKGTITLNKKTIAYIIENYTRESGVRELDKTLAKLFRKLALKIAKDEPFKKSPSLDDIREYLGIEKYNKDRWSDNNHAGVVTGLAWTAVGGEILFVETSVSKGKGKLTLTGNLGDVMKESAVLALEYIRAHATDWNLDADEMDEKNIHVHVPEGAIPKDGPSAGITMVTSIMSAFTRRKVRARLAMTGEITLRGKVLAVGGIKEKILAAKRAGITDIILSEENSKDIKEIKEIYLEGLTFHFVKNIDEVLKIALLDEIA